MFRKLKSVVVFLKLIVSFVLTRPFNKYVCFLFSSLSLLHKQDWFVFMPSLTFTLVKCSGQVFFNLKGNLYIEKMTRYM